MTISSSIRKAGPFVGNGSASVFAFTFRVFQASDLEVVRITVATGVETTLTLNSDYTVSLNADQNGNAGGTITLTAGALASGYNMIITSNIANLQPTDLTNQGGFYPEVITQALDRATIQIQQLDERLDRSLAYPVTDPSLGVLLPAVAQRAGKALVFDSLGNPTVVDLDIPSRIVLDGSIEFETFSDMISDVSLAYSNVVAGQTVHVRKGDFTYEVASSGSSNNHLITAGGVKLYVLRGPNGWNMLAFGADNTGVSDASSIFQAVLDIVLAARTGFTGFTAYGQDKIYFPKGNYRLNSGVTAGSSVLGLEVYGDGPHATAIEFYNDSAAMFTATSFQRLTFRDMTINHVPQNADRSTWTNKMFSASGTGGGRMLRFYNVAVYNFNIAVNNTGGVNWDTFSVEYCDFYHFNVFYYGRNSQAVINSIRHSTFFGRGDLMKIAGVGHTTFDTCNIVIDGAWLNLYGVSGLWGPTSIFTFINVKGEPLNMSAHAGGSRSSVVTLDSTGDKTYITCQIRLINSGMTSSVALDPLYPQIEMTSNMSVQWEGGQLKNTAAIKLWPTQLFNFNSNCHYGLFFDGLRTAPPPSQVTRVATMSSVTTYPQVVYERCIAIPNICLGWAYNTYASFPPTMDKSVQRNCIGSGAHYYGVLTFGTAITHELNYYGSPQAIDDLSICVVKKVGGASLTVEISLDNFATTLETLTISGAGGASYINVAKAVTSVGVVGTDKLYVKCSGVEAYGYIQATIRAV